MICCVDAIYLSFKLYFFNMKESYNKNTFEINREEFVKFAKEARNEHLASNHFLPDPISSENRFIFFLLDIVEWNAKQPGHLYLFGKTYNDAKKSYVSCCVSVKYCHKRIYLLPREYFQNDPFRKVSWEDICDEFCNQILPHIETCEIECNQVRKKFAFHDGVPSEADYLEIKCKVGNFKLRSKAGNTYSKILGINTGYKETFILERNIKGPCWLEVANYNKGVGTSQCEINIVCKNIEDVTTVACGMIPPITLMGLEFKTFHNKKNEEEILSVSCIVEKFSKTDFVGCTTVIDYFCILSSELCKYDSKLIEECVKSCDLNIRIADGDVHLLMQVFGCIHMFDPDVLYGHGMIGHNIDLIYSKIVQNQTFLRNYYRIPKIHPSRVPPAKYKKDLFIGRILFDTKIIAEELVKSRSYSIHDLSVDVLKIPHCDFPNNLFEIAFKDVKKLLDFIYTIMWDITCTHKFLEKFNVMELIIQISKLCGNTLKNSCDGYISNRCEYLLLRKYHDMNYIVPCRYAKRLKKKTMPLGGGLVLEPVIGLHKDFVLAMDFNSLYPSIIQEYKVCFTTLKRTVGGKTIEVNGEGVLPQLIEELLKERKRILYELSTINSHEESNYVQNLKIKQEIIKRMTNTIYGYLACDGSRFMADHLASFITEKGRLILTNTVNFLTDNSHSVIYGDTDSVMIKTNLKTYEEVEQLSRKLTNIINSQYKYINIEKASIYKSLLILRKKKYAGIKINENGTCNEEIKGLDVIRRDWSPISSVIARNILTKILKGIENISSHIAYYLADKKMDLVTDSTNYDDELFVICKKLSKNPEEYSNKNNYEHVKLACQFNEKCPNKFKANDIVSYVVCTDGSSRPHTDRVYLFEEYKKSSNLSIDIQYYISQQIYPVLKRTCAGIDDIISERSLQAALSMPERREVQQHKKRKIDETPKYDPLLNFIVQCNLCEIDSLVFYDSLEIIKDCNCNENSLKNFNTKLYVLLDNISTLYRSRKNTYKKTGDILSKVRSYVDSHKRFHEQYSDYRNMIEECGNIIFKHYSTNKVCLKELFKYNRPSSIKF